jgi:DNA-binding NarL/FixJ family response regulator
MLLTPQPDLVTLRVVIGDDSLLAREGILRMLDSLAGVEVVAVAEDLPGLRDVVARTGPDIVISDIRMPPSHTDEGIQFANELRDTDPRIGVLLLSQHAQPFYATALFERGSERRGYLLKERIKEKSEIERALRTLAGGGSLIDSQVVTDLLNAQNRDESAAIAKLTDREREILALIAEGFSNAAIADRLDVTKRAVERHINSIFWKLDLGDTEDVSRRVKAALVYLSAPTN